MSDSPKNERQWRRLCVFCGTGTGSSREHVFSEWAASVIGKTEVEHQEFQRRLDHQDGVLIESDRMDWTHQGDALSRKVRGICEECNNTWMSVIENEAKAVAAPLMTLERASLSAESQAKLARWITLKTLVNDIRTKNPLRFPPTAFTWFYENKDPLPGSKVYIATFTGLAKTPSANSLVKGVLIEGESEPVLGSLLTLLAWKHLLTVHIWNTSAETAFHFRAGRARYLSQMHPFVLEPIQFPSLRTVDDAGYALMVQMFAQAPPVSFARGGVSLRGMPRLATDGADKRD